MISSVSEIQLFKFNCAKISPLQFATRLHSCLIKRSNWNGNQIWLKKRQVKDIGVAEMHSAKWGKINCRDCLISYLYYARHRYANGVPDVATARVTCSLAGSQSALSPCPLISAFNVRRWRRRHKKPVSSWCQLRDAKFPFSSNEKRTAIILQAAVLLLHHSK